MNDKIKIKNEILNSKTINNINILTNNLKNKYNMLLKEHSNLQNKFFEERQLSIYYEMEYNRLKIYNDKLFTEYKELEQFQKDTLKQIEKVSASLDNKKILMLIYIIKYIYMYFFCDYLNNQIYIYIYNVFNY